MPQPNWVMKLPLPEGDFAAGADRKIGYRIVSYQDKIDPTTRYRYRRINMDLNNSQALEDEGTLGITFDPSYQSLTIHNIRVIRDGQIIDKISQKDFKLFKVETDADKLIYNGNVRFSYSLTDLRVGDQLDYSYTVIGRNPAFKHSYFIQNTQNFSVPVEKFHSLTAIHKSLPVHTRIFNGGEIPEKTVSEEYNIYEFLRGELDAVILDSDRPNWHYGRPSVEYSSFENWVEVGKKIEPYYLISKKDRNAVASIVEDIRNATSEPKEQALSALHYVQKNIRYLGIELGEGGYIPRSPTKTLAQRFGDCKDVTLLLKVILEELGFESNPVLVNTKSLGKFTLIQPTPFAFDHVIVGTKIDGTKYFLDATRNEQLGNLDHIDQGVYGKGLQIKQGASGLIDMAPTEYPWRKDFEDVFDLVSDPDKITFTTTARYFGGDADSILSWYRNDGIEVIEKTYLNYFKDLYPTIEQIKPTDVKIDNVNGSMSFTSYYEIPNAWTLSKEDNLKQFSTLPYELRAEMPKFSGVTRSSPMKIAYPKKIRQVIRYKVDDSWSLTEIEDSWETDNLAYNFSSRFSGDVYSEIYAFESKADHMAADSFAEDMVKIDTIRNELETTMQDNITPPSGWEAWSEDTWQILVMFWLFGASVISAIFAIFIRDFDLSWRAQLTLHPVSIRKFIILSIATLGVYQIYWFYKNWQWYNSVANDDLQPAVRSFFAGIMNFSLFTRIANESDKGYKWFRFAAFPLACLYLASNILDSAITRVPTLPDWLSIVSLASVFISLPVAIQVKHINKDNPELTANNSHFTWRSYGLIALFFPITLLTFVGGVSILIELI